MEPPLVGFDQTEPWPQPLTTTLKPKDKVSPNTTGRDYAVFGKVISGMEANLPESPNVPPVGIRGVSG